MALKIVRGNIEDRTLRELVPSGQGVVGITPFSDLSENGPWPDILICRFECTSCGQLYQLSADAFHGSGGQWAPSVASS